MGRVPQPLQPFLHDLVSQVAAPTQAWSTPDGQVVPRDDDAAGVAGLLHGDVRLLSGIEVTVDGDPGVPVAHLVRADGSVVFTSLLRGLDAAYADSGDPRVRLDRTRTVVPGRLTEELVLGSTLDVDVEVRVAVRLTPDATPMELVRVGAPRVAVTPAGRRSRVDLGGDRRDDRRPGRRVDRRGRPGHARLDADGPATFLGRGALDGRRRRPGAGRGRRTPGPHARPRAARARSGPAARPLAGTFRGRPRGPHDGAARQPGRRVLRRGRALVLHPLRPRQPLGGAADAAARPGRRARHAADARPAPGPHRRPADRGAAGQDPARAASQRLPARRDVAPPALLRHGRRHPAVGLPAARRAGGPGSPTTT